MVECVAIWEGEYATAENSHYLANETTKRLSQSLNQPLTNAEEEALECSETKSIPYGRDSWIAKTVKKYGIEQVLKGVGGREMVADPIFTKYFLSIQTIEKRTFASIQHPASSRPRDRMRRGKEKSTWHLFPEIIEVDSHHKTLAHWPVFYGHPD